MCKPHHAAILVVQQQTQIIELQDAVQAVRQIVKQLAEVAMAGDGLGNFQQNLILAKRRALGPCFGRRNFHGIRITLGGIPANPGHAR